MPQKMKLRNILRNSYEISAVGPDFPSKFKPSVLSLNPLKTSIT